jgi:murein DD-endopeptidase MepM/ murein hydrolase activator NlpD
MSYKRAILVSFLAFVVSGCASAPVTRPPKTGEAPAPAVAAQGIRHEVKKGETLWRISKNYGVDLDTLVKANNLADAEEINAGQTIIIPKKSVKRPEAESGPMPVFPHEDFVWPVKGDIITSYGEMKGGTPSKGIDIKAREGTVVIASRSGRVIFCEDKVRGFGRTVIIDHGDGIQTVYSHNSEILVSTGQDVTRSEPVAKVGSGGRGNSAYLHFEIRRKHAPQNPIHYLRAL